MLEQVPVLVMAERSGEQGCGDIRRQCPAGVERRAGFRDLIFAGKSEHQEQGEPDPLRDCIRRKAPPRSVPGHHPPRQLSVMCYCENARING